MGARQTGIVLAIGAACVLPSVLAGQETSGEGWSGYELEARIWLDRGSEPVLERGERVRVYYRVSEDANVAIFHIDTDGTVRLIFPRSPRENHIVLGGRDYRVLFPSTSYWFVDEDPGMGYFFIVAAPSPLDLSRFTYSYHDGGWDLSGVSRQVYSDPYEAMDDFVAALIPNWETTPYALDFTDYHVGAAHEYPRFLCYDCHGFQPYYAWNPYYYACTSFQVVVYNDPYFYPAYRYGGGAVVTPPLRHRPRFAFKERPVGETAAVVHLDRGAADVPIRRPTSAAGGTPQAGAVPFERRPTVKEHPLRGSERLPIVVPWPGRTRNPDARSGRSGTPSTGRTERPSQGGSVVPPTRSESRPAPTVRPTLERRPSPRRRPSARVDTGGGGTSGSASRVPIRRPNAGPTRPAVSRPGGVRPGPGSARPVPSRRPGGASARPAPARRPGGASARPAPARRPGGASARPAPARRPGGASARPAPRGPTRGSLSRPTPRRRGGGG